MSSADETTPAQVALKTQDRSSAEGVDVRDASTLSASLPPEPPSRVPALRPTTPPPRKRRWWLWAVGGLIGLLGTGGLYTQVFLSSAVPVVTEVIALAPVTRVLAVNGRIAALRSVDVQSVVSGRLTKVNVAEGDAVNAGDTLAQVDAATAIALMRQAVASLDAALVRQAQAAEAFARAQALGATIPRMTLEDAAHSVEVAAQEVARQTALLDQAQIGLQNYTIKAPAAGTVLSVEVEEGQLVGPATPLLTLADLSTLVVEADVDEAYATQIVLGQPAVLQLAGETSTRDGAVSFVSTRVDVATGGLAIKMTLDDDVTAPIGLTVTSNIIIDQRDAALTVPRTALQSIDGVEGIFVVSDGRVRFQKLSLVAWPAARLIVTEGLKTGTEIVTDALGLRDGQEVTAMPATAN